MLQIGINGVERILKSDFDNGIMYVQNENLQFRVHVPNQIALGIGTILKVLATCLSIHNNSKVQNLEGYILGGNYSSVLDARHIVQPWDDDSHSPHELVQVFSYRLLVLRSEMQFIPPTSVLREYSEYASYGYVADPTLRTVFEPMVFIDHLFDCSVIPPELVDRIMTGIRRIQLHPRVLAESALLTSRLIEPSLGISVRSFRAPHEVGSSVFDEHRYSNVSIKFDYQGELYKRIVLEAVQQRGVRSVMIAFDNPEYLYPDYEQFLNHLYHMYGVRVIMLSPSVYRDDLLLKAAVELVSLSRTRILTGTRNSTFLDMTYWFGECKQSVYFIESLM